MFKGTRLVNSKVIGTLIESGIFSDFNYEIYEVYSGFHYWKESGGKMAVGDDDTIVDIELEESFQRYVDSSETFGFEDVTKQKNLDKMRSSPVSYIINKQRELLGHVFDNVFIKTFGFASLKAIFRIYEIERKVKFVKNRCCRVFFLVNRINQRNQKNGEPMAFVDVILPDMQSTTFTVFASDFERLLGGYQERFTDKGEKFKTVTETVLEEGEFYYADVKVNLWNERYSLLFNSFGIGSVVTKIGTGFDYSAK